MRLTFTLSLRSDYHVGAGHGSGSQVDSALQRDADQVPVLRSSPEGLLRDGLWRLLQTPPLAAQRRCKASGLTDTATPEYCTKDPCPLCAIVGRPSKPKRWRFSSGRPVGAEHPLHPDAVWAQDQNEAHITPRIRVSPHMRRAEAKKLFTQEEGYQQFSFTFTADCPVNDVSAHHEAAFLVAAARMVRRMGAARRRGRGSCLVTLDTVDGWHSTPQGSETWQAILLQHFQRNWLEDSPPAVFYQPLIWSTSAATRVEPRRFDLAIRLDEPCVIAKRAEAGNIFDCAHAISGSTLLGALAAEAASRWDLNNAETYTAFLNMFRHGQVRFQPLYIAYKHRERIYPSIPAPRDILVCKVRSSDLEHLPLRSYATQMPPRECSECASEIPLVALNGYIAMPYGPKLITPTVRDEIHPRIDPHTQRVAAGDLFGYVGLESGQYFMGELWCQDESAWQTLCQLTQVIREKEVFQLRLGKATRRGYGQVSAWLQPVADAQRDPRRIESIAQRVTKTDAPITLTLLTDAILPDAWGRFHQTFDQPLLKSLIGQPVELRYVFCQSINADGFNNHLGLPRWRDIALRAGSAVGFVTSQTTELSRLQDTLQRIEDTGIGLRRHEGFGQVVFNHPVYTNPRELSGPHLNLQDCPGMSLARPDASSWVGQLKLNANFLGEWSNDLQRETTFPEQLFRGEMWQAVARWLHSNAARPVDELIEQLSRFGDPRVLSSELRSGQDPLEMSDPEAMAHLQGWLKQADAQAPGMRRVAIELLANRIAVSVSEKEH